MERGASLIVAMLILAFLSILGGALLTTAAIEVRIVDNYRTNTQLLYLAEAGIEAARDKLTTTPEFVVNNDIPLFDDVEVKDATDRVVGRYDVYVRDDAPGGALRIVSTATIKNDEKTIEAVVTRAKFPYVPAALTLGGSLGDLDLTDSNLVIDSTNVNNGLETKLTTVSGLERLAAGIGASNGSGGQYKIEVVHGDADLGSRTGYGILLVRGKLTITGPFTWNGLILVIGQGQVQWNAVGSGHVNGAMFVARTLDADGNPLAQPGPVTLNFNAATGSIHYDAASIEQAGHGLPFIPISIRER